MPRAPKSEADAAVDDYLASLEELHEQLDGGVSFSGHERNRVFLNCRDGAFADASAVSGLDFDDDGRGVGLFDWEGDGDLDVAISNRTAPRVRLMRNVADLGGGFLSLRLVGDGASTNRDAIGARVTVETSSGSLVRTVRAGDGFLSQSSLTLHVGLGDEEVSAVRVRWPGGGRERFDGVDAGGRYTLVQGTGAAAAVGSRSLELVRSEQVAEEVTSGRRVVLAPRLPAPELTKRGFDSASAAPIRSSSEGPILLNLWATWCVPCREELEQLTDRAADLAAAGIEVVALSLDGMGDDPPTRPEDASTYMEAIGFPFEHGRATSETLDKVDIVQRYLFDRRYPLALPFSLLLDEQNRVAILYRGGVSPDRLRDDVDLLSAGGSDLRELSVPFPGRWFTPPAERIQTVSYARWFRERFPDDAIALLERGIAENEQLLEGGDVETFSRLRARHDLVEAHRSLAGLLGERGEASLASGHFRAILAIDPDDAAARAALLSSLYEGGEEGDLEAELRAALEDDPRDPDLHVRQAELHDSQGRPAAASESMQRAVDLRPDDARLRFLYGQTLAKEGRAREAEIQFEEALRLDPAHVGALTSLGQIALGRGDATGAIERLERAVAAEPQNLEARYGLARSLTTAGRLEAAVPHFEELVRLAPQNPAAHHELGVALLRLGRNVEGVDSVQRAYAIDETFLEAADDVAWILAAHPEQRWRDGRLALSLARDISTRADEPRALYLETLGAALAETGDFEGARASTLEALAMAERRGDDPLAARLRSWLESYAAGEPVRFQRR